MTAATPCPTPSKTGWATYNEAEQALFAAWRKGRPGKLPLRAYLCPCGEYHLTSIPLNRHKENRNHGTRRHAHHSGGEHRGRPGTALHAVG